MRSLLLVCTALILSGCTPADYIHLYNATGEQIVISKDKSKEVVTIASGASADFSPVYLPGERVTIRTIRHTWIYSPRALFPPSSLYQQHVMVMRAFARIDRHGQIYLLAPPDDRGSPKEITQPAGFPVKPQKT